MRSILRHRFRVGLGALALILLITVGLASRPPADPFAASAITDPPFTSLTYGIQAFLWWDNGTVGTRLDQVRLMVFSHVKQTFAWEDIEKRPGAIDLSRADAILGEIERRDLRLVVRLSDVPEWAHPSVEGRKDVNFIDAPPDPEFMDAWSSYCGAVAGRYPGRIAAYQIWNEPNLSREWGNRSPNAAEYVTLLTACTEAIRAADPAAIIISAGLSPTGTCCDIAQPDDVYLQALYDAGFQQHIDVVGMHAPGYSAPDLSPDEAERNGSQRFFTFRRVEDLREIMVKNGDASRQAAILEVGWTTDTEGYNPNYSWFAVDEETQARYLVEAYQYAADHWRPWVGLMSTIYMADPGWTKDNEEYWWAITRPGRGIRPAYIKLANMAKYCGDRVIPARPANSPEALGLVPVDPCR
ncbi:MAG: cellulase family glycosylhydrolase [Anaerolineae bacterium]|nr:cellulase family glycosylhydrolase [Anaerolineae bacterium]